MSRYIDADKIDFNECFVGQSDFARDTREAAQNLIDKQPTADVEPVRHGHWRFQESYYDADECICSRCSQHMTTHIKERMLYCPNCGAKMDEEVEQ